jgi:hypothetical protein
MAIWRATASVPPPAAHGTIRVIGRSGKGGLRGRADETRRPPAARHKVFQYGEAFPDSLIYCCACDERRDARFCAIRIRDAPR